MPGTDAEIIRRSLDDPEAFAEIFDRHYDRIFRFAASRGGREAGADIAADVFVIAFRKREKYDAGRFESAHHWLYGIGHRLLKQHYRRAARGQRAVAALETTEPTATPSHADAVAARLDAEANLDALRSALRRIPARFRDPLLLHAIEGMPYEDIAEALDLPIGTVRSRIARGRKKIRELLPPSGQIPEMNGNNTSNRTGGADRD